MKLLISVNNKFKVINKLKLILIKQRILHYKLKRLNKE